METNTKSATGAATMPIVLQLPTVRSAVNRLDMLLSDLVNRLLDLVLGL